MPWLPPNSAYRLNCQPLAGLSGCGATTKGQQNAKAHLLVNTNTYPPTHQSGSEKRICNRSHHNQEGGLDVARFKDNEKSYGDYFWSAINSVLTLQSPPAMPTLTKKTYKRAARGTVLASFVSTFLLGHQSNSPNYDWPGHYHCYFSTLSICK